MSNRSFSYPNTGPFGICLNQQLQQTFDQNVAFSDTAWENAKQNCQYGCVLPPGIPQWPPGVTPLSAPAAASLKAPIARTDAQIINTLQSKPFQFDSPFVEKTEYKRFVPNDSPAVLRSLENSCGSSLASASPAQLAQRATQGVSSFNPVTELQAASLPATGSTMNANVMSLFFQSLVTAVRGLAYDAKNFSQLPGQTIGQKLKFMATHDPDRVTILVSAILVLLAIIVFIVLLSLVGCGCCKKT